MYLPAIMVLHRKNCIFKNTSRPCPKFGQSVSLTCFPREVILQAPTGSNCLSRRAKPNLSAMRVRFFAFCFLSPFFIYLACQLRRSGVDVTTRLPQSTHLASIPEQ